jgi:hypothetical protein
MIRKSKRCREATHGFLVYTEADGRLDEPHTPAPALRKRRARGRHRTLRSRLGGDADAGSTPST